MMSTVFSLNKKTNIVSQRSNTFPYLSLFYESKHIILTLQADLCMPRLNEGDQVVQINGRDISEHTHDQVVMFIKASCESHSGELILLVRPNGKLFLCLFLFFSFLFLKYSNDMTLIQLFSVNNLFCAMHPVLIHTYMNLHSVNM